ncbi:serine/arginine-rich splicing factor 11-like isoform X2 [Mercenaria mercenaria]|uniref:serine/arginine-rich splicing factor 11-like isoform X2 n=1 Tax=Mercenaria mercenaria TaxID=6596 RepID=UPI00234F31D8|nr:serine/arginine-rich splicing factor 11-like isoform X2 [Mercenaria mercenaria]
MSYSRNRRYSNYSSTRRSRSRIRRSRDNYHYSRHRSPSPRWCTRHSRSRSRCSRDNCHYSICRSPSPRWSRSRNVSRSRPSDRETYTPMPSSSWRESPDTQRVRASTPVKEPVSLLPDIEEPLIRQLSEPVFPELYGTFLSEEMIWQMEEWRLEAERNFDFGLLSRNLTRDNSDKGSRKRGREDQAEVSPPAKRQKYVPTQTGPNIHINRNHPNFRSQQNEAASLQHSISLIGCISLQHSSSLVGCISLQQSSSLVRCISLQSSNSWLDVSACNTAIASWMYQPTTQQ